MAYPAQATPAAVTAAGLVRLTGLAQQYLFLKDNHQPVDDVEARGIDLRQKLEALALTNDAAELLDLLADLGETYDLPEGVYTDPLLRATLPPVPANGAAVRPLVLRIQGGKVLRIQGGKVLGIGYRLVPATGPAVYNTRLLTTQTTGAVTFTGAVGDYFEFNMPMNAATGGPQQMFLFVNNVQVAGVDFPSDAVGQPFRLHYNGVDYAGIFQIVAGTSRVDLLPE